MINRVKAVLISVVALSIGWWFGSRFGSIEESRDDVKIKMETEAQAWTCSMHPNIRQPERACVQSVQWI